LVILTEWEEFRWADYEELAKDMKGNIIIDGRNIREKRIVEKFWFVYECIGR
jgi:UDPglucose 6-dehydrogenase